MVMLTYQLLDSIRQIAMQGEFDGFDLNIFFSVEGEGRKARFKYEDEVQKWLDLIRFFLVKPLLIIYKWVIKNRLYRIKHTEQEMGSCTCLGFGAWLLWLRQVLDETACLYVFY
jgi:hypothetical protein